jgi:hypothetical protein
MLTETRNNFVVSKFKITTGCPLQQKRQLLVLLAPKTVKVDKEHTVAKNINNQLVLLICIRLTSNVLTLNLPTTTIVAQPFNVIKWQLDFNPVA